MSPEQISGDRDLDGRSDEYSLACVLYEMLTGEPPFRGGHGMKVIRQHLLEKPEPVSKGRPSVPTGLDAALAKALEKEPEARFATVREFKDALGVPSGSLYAKEKRAFLGSKAIGAGFAAAVLLFSALGVFLGSRHARGPDSQPPAEETGSAESALDPNRIAVAAFDVLGNTEESAFLGEALTEAFIGRLKEIDGLDVVSFNGVLPYRNQQIASSAIAAGVGAGTLVRGTINAADDGYLDLALRIVDGNSGRIANSATISGVDRNLVTFLSQAEVAVGQLLSTHLGRMIQLRPVGFAGRQSPAITSNSQALVLYWKGNHRRVTAESLAEDGDLQAFFAASEQADSLLTEAINADPSWVQPIDARGWNAYRRSRVTPGIEDILDEIDEGMSWANRALGAAPDYASSLELRGTLQYWRWLLKVTPDSLEAADLLRAAQDDLERAVDIDPHRASAFSTLSHLYYQLSDLTSALLSAYAAVQEDPYMPIARESLWRVFLASYDTEQFTTARSACENGNTMYPADFRFVECQLLSMSLSGGEPPDIPQAWSHLELMTALTPESLRAVQQRKGMIEVAEVIARAELPDSARSVLLRARAGADVDPYLELPFLEAHVRVVLGDYDEAVELLRYYMADSTRNVSGEGGDWSSYWWWRELRGHEGFLELARSTR